MKKRLIILYRSRKNVVLQEGDFEAIKEKANKLKEKGIEYMLFSAKDRAKIEAILYNNKLKKQAVQ